MRNLLKCQHKTFFIFNAVLFVLIAYSNAQTVAEITVYKPNQLKRLAQKCELRGDYYTALEYMEESIRKNQNNAKSTNYIAELYMKSKQYDSAIVYFSNPLINDDKKFPLRKYYLGQLYMIVQEYEEAKKVLNNFRRSTTNSKEMKTYSRLARNFMVGCDTALNSSDNHITAYINNLGPKVNTEHIEFSPYPIDNKRIIYGTLPIDSVNEFSHSKNNAPVRKLYVAEKIGKTWQSVGTPEWDINHPDFNTGNFAFSPDLQRIYYTRCFQNWKYKTICEIFMLERENKAWTNPKKLSQEINTENYTTTHPTVGTNPKDGSDILYFATDRPEGKGGMDIWYASYNKRKNTFKTPRNLGSRINTSANEITPYYNPPTQSLYYSSNGLAGYGGFDIYQSKGWGRKWEKSSNIGTPVNSSYNDTYLALNNDGNSGFFTSNRPGSQLLNNTCCDDVYFFNWKLPKTIPAKGLIIHQSSGKIIDKINSKFGVNLKTLPEETPLDNVPVYLYQIKENGDKVLLQTSTTKNGKYHFNLERDKEYLISIENYGYQNKSVPVTTKNYLSDDTLTIESAGITHIPNVELAINIFYETGEAKLTLDDKKLLDSTAVYLLQVLPSSIIEIGSHTDNVGKKDFNLKLSQKRAEDVLKYLQSRKVSDERLVAKGYGMSMPKEPNVFPDGTDNPEGRQKNRRTELRIIGILTVNKDIEE